MRKDRPGGKGAGESYEVKGRGGGSCRRELWKGKGWDQRVGSRNCFRAEVGQFWGMTTLGG